ncbi:TPA: hypothetical protein I8038_003035 [Legionella pneumophila]|nr:hypothetical protein [Legionella pneumophila]HAT2058897.1 hypothetical protein [Legionella pneumophila]HBB6896716.1 hypothetical protein [Legionella pneumophila]HBB6898948.1 hypothetical protein [Legionella pneumophila]
MKAVANRYHALCQEKVFIRSLLSGFFLLFISFLIMNFAGKYASLMAGNPVNDLILDNLPLRDVTVFHVNAAIIFWTIFTIYTLLNPALIPFITKSAALFILIRCAFISMTHLGAPPNQLAIPDNFSSLVLFDGDLFFSGHVGGPFLMMLIFWNKTTLRYICLAAAVFFAYTVLIGHIHYSIDVFAAPFITYGIFHISQFLFASDYQRLKSELTSSTGN